jgi:hypothetical protein
VGGVSEESEERSPRCGRDGRRPANKPVVKVNGLELHLSPEDSASRCKSKGRGMSITLCLEFVATTAGFVYNLTSQL